MPDFCPKCGSRTETKIVEGTERDYCDSCEEVLWKNPKPAAATAVVKEDQILLVKRGEDPDKGQWSLPAGFIELEDSFRKGAVRELEEETGLSLETEDLGLFETLKIKQHGNEHVVVAVFKTPASKTEGEIQAGEDAAKARYWSREEVDQNIEKIRKPYRDIIKSF
jgi:ADP-ribose pyrophosphatase YjhB (NUDIX family)